MTQSRSTRQGRAALWLNDLAAPARRYGPLRVGGRAAPEGGC